MEEKTIKVSELERLLAQWRHKIDCKMQSAAAKKDEFARNYIDHGAVNIHNCVRDLQQLINIELYVSSNKGSNVAEETDVSDLINDIRESRDKVIELRREDEELREKATFDSMNQTYLGNSNSDESL